MEKITWSQKYLIGHTRIDFEHQIFADLINTLIDKIDHGVDRLSLSRTLREIIKYADFHFTSEENIMTECGYPGMRDHAVLHSTLLDDLNKKVTSLAANEINPAHLLDFLVDWFVSHTTQEDLRISLYCREHGIDLADQGEGRSS